MARREPIYSKQSAEPDNVWDERSEHRCGCSRQCRHRLNTHCEFRPSVQPSAPLLRASLPCVSTRAEVTIHTSLSDNIATMEWGAISPAVPIVLGDLALTATHAEFQCCQLQGTARIVLGGSNSPTASLVFGSSGTRSPAVFGPPSPTDLADFNSPRFNCENQSTIVSRMCISSSWTQPYIHFP